MSVDFSFLKKILLLSPLPCFTALVMGTSLFKVAVLINTGESLEYNGRLAPGVLIVLAAIVALVDLFVIMPFLARITFMDLYRLIFKFDFGYSFFMAKQLLSTLMP